MHVDKIFILIFIVMLLVGLVSSFMGSTWAVISWSFVYTDYPIITYEIGYEEQPSDICSESSSISLSSNLTNVTSSTTTNITDLMPGARYLFAVRAYTVNSYGEWRIVANETLNLPIIVTITGKALYDVLLCMVIMR